MWPIVTVEDYLKWYSVYVIQVAGTVVKAHEAYPKQWLLLEQMVAKEIGKSFYGDHIWHPWGIERFAILIGGQVDETALAVLTYRWWAQHLDGDLSKL